jgi:hypothetical protein
MASGILSLNSSLAPRLIRILYIVAVIFIAIGVLLRVGQGVMRIAHPPLHHATTAAAAGEAPGTDQSTTATRPSAVTGSSVREDGRMGFGHRRFDTHRFHGPRLRLLRVVPRDQRPLVFGIFRIVFALIWGTIAVMVVRVLAELANAVLTLAAIQRP